MIDPPPPPAAEIVVTGRGLESPAGDGIAVVDIDRDRIGQAASGRLEDILRSVAGLTSFRRSDSRSSHPTSQGLTTRGLGGNAASRMLLTVDGVPWSDPFGGWVNFAALELNAVDRIEVRRGGGSGYAGPGALAGTVVIDTLGRGPADGRLAVGTRETLDLSLGGALSVGGAGGFLRVNGGIDRGNGFVPIVQQDRGPVDKPASYRQQSLRARLVQPVGNGTELQLALSAFFDRRSRGFEGSENKARGLDGSIRLVAPRWSLLAYGQGRRFASRFASISADRTTTSLTLDQYRVPASGFGGRAEWAPLSAAVELRVGGDLRRVSGETNEHFRFVAGVPTRDREAGGRSLTVGPFADARWNEGPWTLSLGGRMDRWILRDGRRRERAIGGPMLVDESAADRQGWQWTGRAGVEHRLTGELGLRAAAYRGWRLPTLNELYRPFRVGPDATAANAALDPEQLAGIEAGTDWTPDESLRLSLTFFRNRLDGAIANVAMGEGPGEFPGVGFVAAGGVYRQRLNLQAIDSRGIELDGEVRRGNGFARLSYALTDARIEGHGAATALDGLPPAQVPRHQGNLTLGYGRADGLEIAATARYLGKQDEAEGDPQSLPAALTLEATARCPLSRRVALELRGENLLDRRLVTSIGGDGTVERAAPRTLWLGIVIR